MDEAALVDRVRAETDTELSRLGSEKVLLAATNAQLEPDAVAGVVVGALASAADRLDEWTRAADDAALADAMADGADRFGSLRAEAAEAWPAADAAADGVLGDLGDPAGDAARAGAGLIGAPLVLDRLLLQGVNFHVNEAEDAAADRVRELREEVEGVRADAAGPLVDRPDAEEAIEGAVGAVEAAYAVYASRLEAMGLDPRPIC